MEKERHIQFWMVRALSDTDLIRQLLAMKIEATKAKMLAVCHTHITVTDNMSSMGLSTKAISAVQKMTRKPSTHGSSCGNCTKYHTPGREHCPAKSLNPLPATLARSLVTGNKSAGSLTRPRMRTRNPSRNLNVDMEEEKGQMR